MCAGYARGICAGLMRPTCRTSSSLSPRERAVSSSPRLAESRYLSEPPSWVPSSAHPVVSTTQRVASRVRLRPDRDVSRSARHVPPPDVMACAAVREGKNVTPLDVMAYAAVRKGKNVTPLDVMAYVCCGDAEGRSEERR